MKSKMLWCLIVIAVVLAIIIMTRNSNRENFDAAPCVSTKISRGLDQNFMTQCNAYDAICGDNNTLAVMGYLPAGQEDEYMEQYAWAVSKKSSLCGQELY